MQDDNAPSPCRSRLPAYDYLLDVPDLAVGRTWHEAGYCGQDLTIGILASRLPVENLVAPLLDDEPLLVINRSEFLPDSNNTTSVRVSNQLILLHTIAPAAHLYLYGLPQNDVNAPTLAAEFTRGAAVLEDPTLPGAPDFPPVRIVANLVANPILTLNATLDPLYEFMADETVLWLNAAGEFGHSHVYLELAPKYINPITDWLTLQPGSLRVPGSGHITDDQFIPFTRLDETADVYLALIWTISAGEFTPYIVDDPITQNRITAYPDAPSAGVAIVRLPLDAEQDSFYVAIEHSRQSNAQEGEAHLYSYNAVTALADNRGSIPPPNDYSGAITVGALWPDESPNSLQAASGQTSDKPEIIAYGSFGEDGETSSGYATLVTAGVAALYRSANPVISPAALAARLRPTGTSTRLHIEVKVVPYDWQRLLVGPVIVLVMGLIGVAIGLVRRRNLRRKEEPVFTMMDVTCEVSPNKSQLTITLSWHNFPQNLPAIALLEPKLTVDMKFDGRLHDDASLIPEIQPRKAQHDSQHQPDRSQWIAEVLTTALQWTKVTTLLAPIWKWIQCDVTTDETADGDRLTFNLWLRRLPSLPYPRENLRWVYKGIQWNNQEKPGIVTIVINGHRGKLFNRDLIPKVESDNTP